MNFSSEYLNEIENFFSWSSLESETKRWKYRWIKQWKFQEKDMFATDFAAVSYSSLCWVLYHVMYFEKEKQMHFIWYVKEFFFEGGMIKKCLLQIKINK